MYIKRQIEEYLSNCINNYPAVLVTGARQVGKTTMISHLLENKGYSFVSLDDEEELALARRSPSKFLDSHPAPLIIDEVQYAPKLFNAIENKINKAMRSNGRASTFGSYILTGSQRYDLMKGVSESMSGRIAIIEMPPLSMDEALGYPSSPFWIDRNEFYKRNLERSYDDSSFYKMLFKGLYPERWEDPTRDNPYFYRNYMKTYLERDVYRKLRVEDKSKFDDFLSLLSYYSACPLIIDEISKKIGINFETAKGWVSILEASGLIYLLPSYQEDNLSKRLVKQKRVYFCDTGLACYLQQIYSVDDLYRNQNRGHLVENFVVNEIIKSYANAGEEAQFSYYRDYDGNEIDLVIRRNGDLNLIEIKSGKEHNEADIKAFSKLVNSSYAIVGGCVISLVNRPKQLQGLYHEYRFTCI